MLINITSVSVWITQCINKEKKKVSFFATSGRFFCKCAKTENYSADILLFHAFSAAVGCQRKVNKCIFSLFILWFPVSKRKKMFLLILKFSNYPRMRGVRYQQLARIPGVKMDYLCKFDHCEISSWANIDLPWTS